MNHPNPGPWRLQEQGQSERAVDGKREIEATERSQGATGPRPGPSPAKRRGGESAQSAPAGARRHPEGVGLCVKKGTAKRCPSIRQWRRKMDTSGLFAAIHGLWTCFFRPPKCSEMDVSCTFRGLHRCAVCSQMDAAGPMWTKLDKRGLFAVVSAWHIYVEATANSSLA
jgi:hypothetical protein